MLYSDQTYVDGGIMDNLIMQYASMESHIIILSERESNWCDHLDLVLTLSHHFFQFAFVS